MFEIHFFETIQSLYVCVYDIIIPTFQLFHSMVFRFTVCIERWDLFFFHPEREIIFFYIRKLWNEIVEMCL